MLKCLHLESRATHAQSWNRRSAQRRQVHPVQRRHPHPQGGGGELSVLHHRSERRHRHGAGRAARSAAEDRQDQRRHSGGDRVRGHRRPREGRDRKAKAWATNSSPTSAKWTPSCRSCAASKTRTFITSPARSIPVRDIEVINTELVLADLEAVKKRRESVAKDVKRGDKAAAAEEAVLAKTRAALDAGKPALTVDAHAGGKRARRAPFFLLTDKPTIFAVQRQGIATWRPRTRIRTCMKVREYVKTHLACEAVVISAQIESDLDRSVAGRSERVSQGTRRARRAASAR